MLRKRTKNQDQAAPIIEAAGLSSAEISIVGGGECELVSISCNYSNGTATTCERTYVCKPTPPASNTSGH